jgi:hypothetical protein
MSKYQFIVTYTPIKGPTKGVIHFSYLADNLDRNIKNMKFYLHSENWHSKVLRSEWYMYIDNLMDGINIVLHISNDFETQIEC